jgi:4-amino-4-deoxy-L-arabinose transferase-like glycosyltransferase
MISERRPFAWREVGVVVAVQAAVLLVMAPFYGPGRDELYFASAGQRLARGYPDQPSFTPLLARLAAEIAPHSVVVLRLLGLMGVVGIVLLAVQFARLLGAGRGGQVLTAVVVATSAVTMAMGHRLTTANVDTLAWTAVLVLATQAVTDERPRLWLVAGVVAGVGLNNKHAVVFLLFGILVACALDRELRPSLRTPWPWLAGLVALLMWVPNLLWQADHDWPVFDLSADIADEYGGLGGRLELVGQAAIMFSR